ncbi:hypothetical protein FRC03_002736 [Tulasnella sp. 419]|nr:hypothetical protein FRC03_002736 [Tulasnella sp. 419]
MGSDYYVYSTTVVVTAFTRPATLPTSPADDSSAKQKKYVGVAVGASVGAFCMACVIGGILYWIWRRRERWWPRDEENAGIPTTTPVGHAPVEPPSRSTSTTKNTEPKDYEYGQYGSTDIKNLLYSPPQLARAASIHDRATSPINQSRPQTPFSALSLNGAHPLEGIAPLPSSLDVTADYNLAQTYLAQQYGSIPMDPRASPVTSPVPLTRNGSSFEKRSIDLASVSSHSSYIYSQSSHHYPSHSGHSHSAHHYAISHPQQPQRPPRQKPNSIGQPSSSSKRPKTAPTVLPSAMSHSPSSWFTNPHNQTRPKSSQSHRAGSRRSSQVASPTRFYIDDDSPSPPSSPVSKRLVVANPDVDPSSSPSKSL